MTIDELKQVKYRQSLFHTKQFDKSGSMQCWRVNGKVQTWKRNPERISVPVKHGLFDFGYITEDNCGDFILSK